MDKQQQLENLGFFSICKQSITIISTNPRLFLQITLTFILPLAFLFLTNIHLSQYFLSNIQYGGYALFWSPSSPHLSYSLLLIRLAYFTLLLIFSVLSTSATVYAVASFTKGKTDDFRTVIRLVATTPKLWARVTVTILVNFMMVFCYSAAGYYVMSAVNAAFLRNSDMGTQIVVGVTSAMVYLTGLVYVNVIWQLAATVALLEEESVYYGFGALGKSMALLQGKMVSGFLVFVVVNLMAGLVEAGFGKWFVAGGGIGIGKAACGGVVSLVVLSGVFLFGLVVETVLYLVCKSYHHEKVDVSERIESCLVVGGGGKGEYESVIVKDLEMEKV